MNHAADAASTQTGDALLDELRLVGAELRAVLASERSAIARLDRPELERLGATKQEVVARLAALAPRVPANRDVRAFMHVLRLEAQATALLAATAAQSVRVVLGYEPTGSYDRRARQNPTHRMRVLAVP